MSRVAVCLCCAVVSACLIPVDAGTDRGCTFGSDQTCSEQPNMGVKAGTCRPDGSCLCNSGFIGSVMTGRCVASVGAGGGAAGVGGGSATAGGGGNSGLPNVMLLIDTSGSMNFPVFPELPGCLDPCTGSNCPSTCPTRISALRGAFARFLESNATAARFGVTNFPDAAADSACAPAVHEAISLPGRTFPDDPVALRAQTQTVSSFIQGFGLSTPVSGGTPTAASLRFLATLPSLTSVGRPRGVILVTDGVPNCNPNNALRCDSMPPPPAELCTTSSCVGPLCRAGYLDQAETVSAVAALRRAGIRTAVVSLSLSLVEERRVMNAMAEEGGATACAPGPACDNQFFEAADEASLLGALNAALARISQ
jgi:hypothetical protein